MQRGCRQMSANGIIAINKVDICLKDMHIYIRFNAFCTRANAFFYNIGIAFLCMLSMRSFVLNFYTEKRFIRKSHSLQGQVLSDIRG